MSDSLLLGIVQGLTEPLPISSSAHLLLLHRFLGRGNDSLSFDAALHVGTALALLAFFWPDWIDLFKPLFSKLDFQIIKRGRLGLILVGTLPAVIPGLLFGDLVERYLRSPVVVAIALVVVGLMMWTASAKVSQEVNEYSPFGLVKAVKIGLAQVLALIPGVSRSGITVSAGLLLGLERQEAFDFSFMMGAPLTLGAGLLQMFKLAVSGAAVDWLPFASGIVSSFVFGFLALRLFRKVFARYGLRPFVVYRIFLALAIIVFFL